VLGVLDRLDLLLPEPAPSPIEQLKMHGKKRQRVRPRKNERGTKSEWTWGEES
jgi:putative transcriptional regulator